MNNYIGRVGNYQLIKSLGAGGMGEVFLAQNPPSNTHVALKLMKAVAPEQYEELQSRFTNEALFVQDLLHPSIVKIERSGETYDYRHKNNVLYIACEYIPGGSLADYIYKEREQGFLLKLDETIELGAQIAEALGYAFATKKLIHRDIKPANILLKKTDKGADTLGVRAIVADFGIAKLMDIQSPTVTGSRLGSPSYASPEQAQGKKGIDGRSDIYSLGILLYELLTGQRPFLIRNWIDAVNFHLKTDSIPPDPSLFVPHLPPFVKETVLRALAKDPGARFQSGSEMAEALWQVKQKLTHDEITGFAQPQYQSFSLLPLVNEAYGQFSVPNEEKLPQLAAANSSNTPPLPIVPTPVIPPVSKPDPHARNAKPRLSVFYRLGTVALLIFLCLLLAGILWVQLRPPKTESANIVTTEIPTFVTPSPAVTDNPTIEPTPFVTRATETPEPTRTPLIATPTLAVLQPFQGNVLGQQQINVYTGPGVSYPKLEETLEPGDVVVIVGVSPNWQWFKIDTPGFAEAWVQVIKIQTTNVMLSQIPVATSAAALSTATPTLTATTAVATPVVVESPDNNTPDSGSTPNPSPTAAIVPTSTQSADVTIVSPSTEVPKPTETPCPGIVCPPDRK